MSSSLLARRLLSRPSPSLRALSRSLASSSKTPVPQAGESTAAAAQAPNAPQPWSDSQRARPAGRTGPRFEQANMELQPNPLSAQALIEQEPIRLVHGRVASCDGGAGPLGHPKVFINLDQQQPKACGYCGIRYRQVPHEH